MPDVVYRNGSPTKNRITRYSLALDGYPRYLTDAPTPSKFVALLKQVDQGDLTVLCQIQMEMERKWDQLYGLAQTRRGALTSLDWCIEPDPNADEDYTFAKDIADYCEDRLSGIQSFADVLDTLSEAIGPNLAVVENIWEKAEIVDFEIVPWTRYVSHPYLNVGVAIKTDEVLLGIPTDELPGKFIVYIPNVRGKYPFRSTLTHASVAAYLMSHFSRADWLAFSELYGQPIRIVTYDDAVVNADRTKLKEWANEGGSDSAIVMPNGAEISLVQATGTGESYEKQLAFVDSKISICWLGQTLTTQVGDSGSRALGDVHDKVRSDILRADAKKEARCIREQLLRHMVALKYPNRPDAPVPVFVRKFEEKRDVESERLNLEQVAAATKLGLKVNTDWLYEWLGIPRPESGDLPEVIQLGNNADELDEDGNPIEPEPDEAEPIDNGAG